MRPHTIRLIALSHVLSLVLSPRVAGARQLRCLCIGRGVLCVLCRVVSGHSPWGAMCPIHRGGVRVA